MKLTNYFSIFAIIFMSLFLLLSYTTGVNVTIDEEDQKYREYLYEATQSALQEIVENLNDEPNDLILWTEENRSIAYQKLLDQFNMLLNYPMNSENQDTTQWLFPVICYIDTDGFYLTYVGVDEDVTANDKRVTSPINTWTITQDGYNIRYYLYNDKLTVTNNLGVTHTGTYDEINAVFGNPSFLAAYTHDGKVDRDAFNKDKMNAIILQTEKQLNYYINNKDTMVKRDGKNYTLSLDISNDEMHKMFTNPGLAVFMQGPTINNSYENVPIFGYAQHQLKKSSSYPVTTDGVNTHYHKDRSCILLQSEQYVGMVQGKKDIAESNCQQCPVCFGD